MGSVQGEARKGAREGEMKGERIELKCKKCDFSFGF